MRDQTMEIESLGLDL